MKRVLARVIIGCCAFSALSLPALAEQENTPSPSIQASPQLQMVSVQFAVPNSESVADSIDNHLPEAPAPDVVLPLRITPLTGWGIAPDLGPALVTVPNTGLTRPAFINPSQSDPLGWGETPPPATPAPTTTVSPTPSATASPTPGAAASPAPAASGTPAPSATPGAEASPKPEDLWQVNFLMDKDAITITWRSFPGVVYYHVLVYDDPSLSRLLWAITTDTSKTVFPRGKYNFDRPVFVFMRATDKSGKEISNFKTSSFVAYAPEKGSVIQSISIETGQVRAPVVAKVVPPKFQHRSQLTQNFSYTVDKIRGGTSTNSMLLSNTLSYEAKKSFYTGNVSYQYSTTGAQQGVGTSSTNLSSSISYRPKAAPLNVSYFFSTFSSGTASVNNQGLTAAYQVSRKLGINAGYNVSQTAGFSSFSSLTASASYSAGPKLIFFINWQSSTSSSSVTMSVTKIY